MARPQLTAVNHYDVFPFNHGGSLGIRGLYKALSEWFDVNIITFVTHDFFPDEVAISNHVKVIPIVLPEELIRIQYSMYEEYGMNDNTLVDSSPTVVRWYHKFPEIIDKVREIAEQSEVVLAEHVFTWRIVKTACPDKHLWYRANNVEYDYKLTTWDKIGCPEDLLQETYDIEKECCEECERVLTVSQLETDRFMELYKLPEEMRSKFMNIRSGYDTDNLQTVLPSQRNTISTEYKYSGVFIASDTPSTRRAAQNCIIVAENCPEIQIVLLGGVGKAFKDARLPSNVLITGIVTDEEKFYYLQNCDFALNLLEGGAGINVKMFEYFAFGIPVITTKYGARGIEITPGKDCILTDSNKFVEDIRTFCDLPLKGRDAIAQSALDMLVEKYSWRSLGRMIAKEMEELYGINISANEMALKEIALYQFEERESYLPRKPFYIRCAGEWGMKCHKFLADRGLTPIAFIDEDEEKQKSDVNGIPIISVKKFLEERKDCEVIIAVGKLVEFAAEMVKIGIPIENISLAWDGRQITTLSNLKGNMPYYNSPEKWKNEIIKLAKNEDLRL